MRRVARNHPRRELPRLDGSRLAAKDMGTMKAADVAVRFFIARICQQVSVQFILHPTDWALRPAVDSLLVIRQSA
jgi:hypothetical protein